MFRCFFLGPDGHFVGAKEVEAPEKHAAIEEARRCCGPEKSGRRPGLSYGVAPKWSSAQLRGIHHPRLDHRPGHQGLTDQRPARPDRRRRRWPRRGLRDRAGRNRRRRNGRRLLGIHRGQ